MAASTRTYSQKKKGGGGVAGSAPMSGSREAVFEHGRGGMASWGEGGVQVYVSSDNLVCLLNPSLKDRGNEGTNHLQRRKASRKAP